MGGTSRGKNDREFYWSAQLWTKFNQKLSKELAANAPTYNLKGKYKCGSQNKQKPLSNCSKQPISNDATPSTLDFLEDTDLNFCQKFPNALQFAKKMLATYLPTYLQVEKSFNAISSHCSLEY